jgi:type II secretory pathway pseudopilin PulG
MQKTGPASVSGKYQRGVSYLWAVITLAVIGIGLARLGEVWSLRQQQAREAELLRRGDAIARAIEAYVNVQGAPPKPGSLEDLVHDPRLLSPRRFLRKVYQDPLTGDDFELIRSADGGIAGVYSRAEGVPLKQGGFPREYASFANQSSYAAWKFPPETAMSPVVPGGGEQDEKVQ